MTKFLPENELVSFKELLIEEGLISQEKFFAKLKQVQAQYQKRHSHA